MKNHTILVSVRLGDPHVARAGSGRQGKIASTTCDLTGEPSGYVAALRAAAKYFDCAEDAIEMNCVTTGDQCARRPAIFQAEKVGGV